MIRIVMKIDWGRGCRYYSDGQLSESAAVIKESAPSIFRKHKETGHSPRTTKQETHWAYHVGL